MCSFKSLKIAECKDSLECEVYGIWIGKGESGKGGELDSLKVIENLESANSNSASFIESTFDLFFSFLLFCSDDKDDELPLRVRRTGGRYLGGLLITGSGYFC